MTCFSPEANCMLPPVTDVLSYIPDPNPYVLPPIIRDLEQTHHVFRLHFATGSRRGYMRFILDSASDAPLPVLPDIQTHVEEGAPSASSVPAAEELHIGTITPPPFTADPKEKEKKMTTAESTSTTVHKELFVPEDEDIAGPETKKAKRD